MGWFRGRLEFGPGALGHRSILGAFITGFLLLLWLVPAHAHLILFPRDELVAFKPGRSSATAMVNDPRGGKMLAAGG